MKKVLGFITGLLLICSALVFTGCTTLLKAASESAFDYAEDKGLFQPKQFEIKTALATTVTTADSLFTVAVSQTEKGYKVSVQLSRSPLQAIADAYIVKVAQRLERKKKLEADYE